MKKYCKNCIHIVIKRDSTVWCEKEDKKRRIGYGNYIDEVKMECAEVKGND